MQKGKNSFNFDCIDVDLPNKKTYCDSHKRVEEEEEEHKIRDTT